LNEAYDIAVVGSGFGGSLLAMIAHKLGRSVILLEKNKHPRFAIGESSTPLSNVLLENLAGRYDLPGIAPLSKWGSWQETYPHVACGLKRGFTFYHHALGAPYMSDPDHERQLLVAASPHDRIADTHWYRAEVDHLFVKEAQKLGVQYLDEVKLQSASESESEIRLQGRRNNGDFSVRAKFVVDATGPRGFLHHALALQEAPLPGFPATQALFSHFTGVGRFADEISGRASELPPYPFDDAAVHHVFDGGWIWVLQFNNGVTSAGVAATDEVAGRLRLSEGPAAWQRLLDSLPALKKLFANSQATQPFVYMPRVSFRSNSVAGKRWALLPSAAGFVDPLLSTGFPLTLLGVSRLAEIIGRDWDKPEFAASLQSYGAQTDNELLAAAELIAALYAAMDRFPVFASLSMLYFAAASFSESARRLGKAHLASSFLLHDDPHFGPAMRRCIQWAKCACTKLEMDELGKDVSQAIEPVNVAGLANPHRRNWYPVEANDLLNSADKLKSTKQEVSQLLDNCGFWNYPQQT
jgi:tetracycline 7-halogenase / FADH2 O2-dependent halogenase